MSSLCYSEAFSFLIFSAFAVVLYLGDILEERHSLPTDILDNLVVTLLFFL